MNISLRTFNKWYNRFKEHPQSNEKVQSWIPVKIEEKSSDISLKIRIGTAVIEVADGFNHKLLIEIVKTLGEIC